MTLTIKSNRQLKRGTLESLVRAALERERENLHFALARTQEQLARFEKRYHTSSPRFFRRYQAGKLDDRDDFIDWSGEYQIFLLLKEKLADLRGLRVDGR